MTPRVSQMTRSRRKVFVYGKLNSILYFLLNSLTGYQFFIVINLTLIQICYLELHILITQAFLNIFHETDPHAFYNHYPPLDGQSRPSVWNNGAKGGAGK